MAISLGPSGLTGKVYQLYTGTFSQSISADTYTAINNISTSITPSTTSSKILLTGYLFHEQGYDAWDSTLFFFRNSTKIGQASSGNRNCGIAIPNNPYYSTDSNSTPNYAMWAFVDTPSTTSSVTYKLGMRTNSNVTVYVNRCAGDGNSQDMERGCSFIMAEEIG
jgi:hypothetical protein